MQLAEKFGLPVISLVDTPGAYPGIGAEERHIGEAIAVNLREMMLLETPIIAAVIGEGGSGGALGIGVADRVLILENAYYSVISPEGCAAILWKERSAAAKAAEALKISAKDLLALGLVDEIVPESPGGAHNDPAETAASLKAALLRNLEDLKKLPSPDRLKLRYDKFRAHGRFTEKIGDARRAGRGFERPPYSGRTAKAKPPRHASCLSAESARPARPSSLTMLPILTFEPIFKERIWGGRNLETLYGKPLPPRSPIGESWEISDRPGDESVVAAGPWKGETSASNHGGAPGGTCWGLLKPAPKRFPLLIKIIDARATLSLQVHPPAALAAELGGEPKTEMWYVAQAGPAAELFVGLKNGVTRGRI